MLMHRHYGHHHWWPGETAFEMCVGAILTQNTSWKNVERAINNLKHVGVLASQKLFDLPERELAELLRPAGYFNVKARRLRSFLEVLIDQFGGDLARLFAGDALAVRKRLLSIKGIGPETADSMMLYAGQHRSFVIDAYTKRIFHRHGWCAADATYDDLQAICAQALNEKPATELLDYWQDYHAQLVNVGKDFCRKSRMNCDQCPLKPLLPNNRG
jgi:endonuclease-3 related protein